MEQLSIPEVNNLYLNNLVDLHKNEFSNGINKLIDPDVKKKLLEILLLRLSGILPKKKFYNYTLEWTTIEFNKNIDYFDDFNREYFSLEKFTTNNFDNILQKKIFEQITKISYVYECYNNLDKLYINKAKKLMVLVCELSDDYHKSINLFQSVLVLNGIKEFITHINNLYPNSINYMCDKIINELNKKINFESIINIFVNIVKKYLYNFILLNKHSLDKLIIDNLLSEYLNVEKNINIIFWIVYHNELKYYDDVIKLYNVDMDFISEKIEKIESNLNENEIEYMDSIETNINLFSDMLTTNVNNKLEELKKNNDNLTINEKINDTINNLIDDEIDSIIKIHLSDPDEIIIFKSQLSLSKEIIKFNITLNNTFDVLMKSVGKK